MMDQISENLRIDLIARHFLNPPHRVNNIHEADAELVDLGEARKSIWRLQPMPWSKKFRAGSTMIQP